MTPVKFQGANRKLLPSGHEYSLNVQSIEPLHVMSDGRQCVSCWEPSQAEREALVNGAHLFLYVLSGISQPPVGLVIAGNHVNHIPFSQANQELGLPTLFVVDGKEAWVGGHTLSVHTDGEYCVSCWLPRDHHRKSLAAGENIYLHVLQGWSQCPVSLAVEGVQE